ncbi:hypothetical protein ANCCEY_14553 [Ancylostoma ceylanicum]|uniref:7TM GPCR serpentine receptor class x (Srx) domain-containing protein n=1 Tax=Ancylostoma ceylanicum TaxID=53326 RepID=A0A0D6L9K0_9BILA|nr:hypothetical protein ANCCEY_14553 [Ancylostoma ceylanicum]
MRRVDDCDFVFEDSIWAFVFTQTKEGNVSRECNCVLNELLSVLRLEFPKRKVKVCKFISWNIDFYKDLSIVIIIGAVDLVTVIKVHITNMKMRRSGQRDRDRRRNKEINFLKQPTQDCGEIIAIEDWLDAQAHHQPQRKIQFDKASMYYISS